MKIDKKEETMDEFGKFLGITAQEESKLRKKYTPIFKDSLRLCDWGKKLFPKSKEDQFKLFMFYYFGRKRIKKELKNAEKIARL